jgi:cytochrome b subunit of formate dehydrogenase
MGVMSSGVLCYFQQHFSYIIVVSFIVGRNMNTLGRPSTCHIILTNWVHYTISGSQTEYTTKEIKKKKKKKKKKKIDNGILQTTTDYVSFEI